MSEHTDKRDTAAALIHEILMSHRVPSERIEGNLLLVVVDGVVYTVTVCKRRGVN
jgi:hypothetical protein